MQLTERWGITEVVAKRQAIDALRASLPPSGLGTDTRDIGPRFIARLRLERWPDAFRWW